MADQPCWLPSRREPGPTGRRKAEPELDSRSGHLIQKDSSSARVSRAPPTSIVDPSSRNHHCSANPWGPPLPRVEGVLFVYRVLRTYGRLLEEGSNVGYSQSVEETAGAGPRVTIGDHLRQLWHVLVLQRSTHERVSTTRAFLGRSLGEFRGDIPQEGYSKTQGGRTWSWKSRSCSKSVS